MQSIAPLAPVAAAPALAVQPVTTPTPMETPRAAAARPIVTLPPEPAPPAASTAPPPRSAVAATDGVFSGVAVLFVGIGLPGCVSAGFSAMQVGAQAQVVQRLKGRVVQLLAEATHIVVLSSRLPDAAFPELGALTRQRWPAVHTEEWVPACSKARRLLEHAHQHPLLQPAESSQSPGSASSSLGPPEHRVSAERVSSAGRAWRSPAAGCSGSDAPPRAAKRLRLDSLAEDTSTHASTALVVSDHVSGSGDVDGRHSSRLGRGAVADGGSGSGGRGCVGGDGGGVGSGGGSGGYGGGGTGLGGGAALEDAAANQGLTVRAYIVDQFRKLSNAYRAGADKGTGARMHGSGRSDAREYHYKQVRQPRGRSCVAWLMLCGVACTRVRCCLICRHLLPSLLSLSAHSCC
jgi:hypothetical protein